MSNHVLSIIWDYNIGAYKLNFPYNDGMVKFIKQQIPSGKRSIDWATKTWFFSPEFFPQIKAVLNLYFPYMTPNIYTKEEHEQNAKQWQSNGNYANPVNTETESEKFRILLVEAGVMDKTFSIAGLTREEATKYYRRAALYYHPDRHPELASKMSELNQLWADLKEVYFT